MENGFAWILRSLRHAHAARTHVRRSRYRHVCASGRHYRSDGEEILVEGRPTLQDRILIGKGVMPQLEAEQPRQIIGIVADVRDGALNQDPGPGMYLPNAQVPDAIQALNVKLTPLAWVVKTRVNPSTACVRRWRSNSGK
jgi:hypothetical protein